MEDQQERETVAYARGRARAEAILAGRLGASQDILPGGAHHREEAAAVARYIGIAPPELIDQVIRYHRERLERTPDPVVYPETAGAADLLRRRYAGMAAAGMDDALIATIETLPFWEKHVMPHQYGKVADPLAINALRERCRVVYLPQSDHGPLHFKNLDDPLASWSPRPRQAQGQPWPHAPLSFDGVGNGLHIDEEPVEIFPLDARTLCAEHCTTVPEVEEFLVRYKHFWDSCNLLVHDEKGNSVAFEKASRNRIAVRQPGANRLNYINGMSAFDEEYEAFIGAQRRKYLEMVGQGEDGVEGCYFRFCRNVRARMKRHMDALEGEPTLTHLLHIMTDRDPDGPLCKSGQKVHPDEPVEEATLCQSLHFLKSRIMLRRQWRGEIPVWEDPWEMVMYAEPLTGEE